MGTFINKNRNFNPKASFSAPGTRVVVVVVVVVVIIIIIIIIITDYNNWV
jgi:hypothetical protein